MTVRRLRPLTITQLRLAAERGELTPQDLQQVRWLTTAKKLRIPSSRTQEILFEFGDFLRSYREARHLSVREFGQLAGYAGCTISAIENRIRNAISLELMIALADAAEADIKLTILPRKQKRKSHVAKS